MSVPGSIRAAIPRRLSRALLPALAAVAATLAAAPLDAQWEGVLSVRGRVFEPAAGRDLANHEEELLLTGGYYRDWDGGRQALSIEPFLRLDPSGERSRFDLRQLAWGYRRGRWDLIVGVQEIFWGVVESSNLVDVVNQRDIVVGGFGYVKLGQPLVGVATRQDWGTLELLLMPCFRERTFSGRAAALWTSGARNWHMDGAIRWSQSIGDWDVGVMQFAGTNRDPRFVPGLDSDGRPTLRPYYDVVNQTAIDAQWTRGSWLWKIEAVTLDPEPGRYFAVAAGVELAFADYLSAFGEYVYDGRGNGATTSFEDDFFVGAQLLLQDGRVRGGTYIDRRTWNTVVSLRAEKRLSEVSLVSIEIGAFVGRGALEPPHARRQHDYLSLNFTRYF
jgi:hypothetical protein